MSSTSSLTLSPEDRGRVEEIARLTLGGAESAGPLVAFLSEKSWAVRRAVVAALARLGTPAVRPLCALLENDRRDEARLAAAVDALALAGGTVDPEVIALGDRTMDNAVLCDCAQILGRRKSVSAVPLLARLSAHTDDNVAVAAIEALGRIGGSTAIEPLIAAVRTRNFFRTYPAIEVLGSSGDPRVTAPLAELLSDPVYAGEAVRALGRTGNLAAVLPLTSLVTDPSSALTSAAVLALVALRDRYAQRFVDVMPLVAAFRDRITGAAVVDHLFAAAESASTQEKAAFAAIFGWLQDTRVVARLVALMDADPAVAAEASKSLRVMGSAAESTLLAAVTTAGSAQRLKLVPLLPLQKTSVPVLVACVRDADPTVRSLACDALARIGDPSAVKQLFGLIGDADARVSQTAVAAIQSLGSQEAETLAIDAAKNGDLRTRRAALRIISYFGYASALGVLLAASADPNERIRDTATQGLAFIEDSRATEALFALANASSPQTRASAARALGQATSTPQIVALLRKKLADEDAWARYYACQALSRLRAHEALPDIAKLTMDPAGQVRVAAVEASARLGGDDAYAVLAHATESDDPDVRRAALTGVGSMKRKDALPLLQRALSSDDAATRLITLSALAMLESPDVVLALVRAMSDADENVRSAAMTLLEQREDRQTTRWLISELADEARREWALGALSTPRDRRVEEILVALETADLVLAPLLVTALMRMQRADSNAAAVALLTSANVAARRAAAAALAASRSAEARDALALARDGDPDEEVRKISAAALS